MTSSELVTGEIVRVLYVLRKDAKRIKNMMENKGLLNKEFRMTQATEEQWKDGCIAVPLRVLNDDSPPEALAVVTSDPAVSGEGYQLCPYSTAVLGNRPARRASGSVDKERPNLVELGLLRALLSFLVDSRTSKQHLSSQEEILNQIRSLPLAVCPKSLEVFGDDRTLVVPLRAFALSPDDSECQFHEFLFQGGYCSFNEDGSCRDFVDRYLWKHLAEVHKSPRVVRRGEVDPNSGIRRSGFRLLWPNDGDTALTAGPGSPTWITVTENGIRQSFDLQQVMFSRGNITEKMRFGQLVQRDEMVLDMYAGIGYFTLPALVHGGARHVVASEWNEHAVEALKFNLQDNGVQDRATVLVGDCRRVLGKEYSGKFERISLGLLPSSEGGWRTAVRALNKDTGGWLHIHGNVPGHEVDSWALWVCSCLRSLLREEAGSTLCRQWTVLVSHVEKVKSFAPNVNHYVADVFLGNLGSHRLQSKSAAVTSRILPGCTGVLNASGHLELCGGEEPNPPSCALSDKGALHQAWMRSL